MSGIGRIGFSIVVLMTVTATVVAQDTGDTTVQDQQQSEAQAQQEQQLSALRQAYQREFVFLDNEIRQLERRLSEVQNQGRRRVEEARNELEKLEAELQEITNEVEEKNEELTVIEDERAEAQGSDETLRTIVTQGNSRLNTHGVPAFADGANAEQMSEEERLLAQVEYIFQESFDLLPELGNIRTEDGEFFLEDGEEVEGTLVHIGQVGSFGVSDRASGTLAPAGGGRLRLVQQDTESVARTLANQGPEAANELPMYLYEDLDELAEVSEGQSFADTVEDGGLIGIVILVIGGVSVLLIVLRSIFLARVGRSNADLVEKTFQAVKHGNLEAAIANGKKIPGAMGRVLTSTIYGLQVDPENIEDVISESVLNEQPALDRFRSALSVFAAVAPLLGLLGTVTGMISTFDVITQFGTGDPQLLSGGISEALITTELGLAVAIPTLLVGNLLASWADRITSNLEVSALRVVNISSGYEGAA
jgi:biopolymer transport protein ExbB